MRAVLKQADGAFQLLLYERFVFQGRHIAHIQRCDAEFERGVAWMGKQNIFTIGAGFFGAAAFKQDASFFPDGFQVFLGKKRPKIQQYVGCGAQRPRQRAQQQNIRVGTGRLPFGHRRGGNAHGLGKLFLRQSLLSAQCLDGFSGWHFHFGKFLSFLLGPVPS